MAPKPGIEIYRSGRVDTWTGVIDAGLRVL